MKSVTDVAKHANRLVSRGGNLRHKTDSPKIEMQLK